MNFELLKQRAKAFDYLFDAVVVTDLNGVIVDWNKGSEILYGYSKQEAIGQAVDIIHVPEDTKHITSEVLSAVQSQGKWSGEVRMLRKDGSIGWIESSCVPVYDENNQMQGAIGINRDITKRKDEIARLEHLAHYDHLTKIPNRFVLLDRLEHLIEQATRDKKSFALLFIDLDKFKNINDTKGHAFGDQVLIETALSIKKTIRNSDTVARFGGDEFVVLLENLSHKNDANTMVELLYETLNSTLMIKNESFKVSCSIGLAIYPDEGTTSDSLIAAADKSMYTAK
ncbi:MAG: diguanylate cyclase (GGDEF)-like protein/PAS domain S-box-containing protein [Alphaproteobacteria bacterium]|jgi:diguanylate cyclase (GGDEF)-like protein/PAS domain S-box-containing protein